MDKPQEFRKIIIPGKKTKNSSSKHSTPLVSLEDFVEIKSLYLIHLHNSYIKYTDTLTNITNSGGFVVSVNNDSVVLRLPGKKEEQNESIPLNTTIFYVKNTNLNYISIQNLILERNKLDFDRSQLTRQIYEFEKYKAGK
jgi:hypothetical protein